MRLTNKIDNYRTIFTLKTSINNLFKRYLVKNIIRLRNLRYLNRSIIFAMDIFLSIAGTMVSFLVVTALIGKAMDHTVVLSIMASSLVVSIVVFGFSGVYKVIIRHSSLKSMTKIIYVLFIKVVLMSIITYYLDVFGMRLILFCVFLDLLMTSFLLISSRAFLIYVYDVLVSADSKRKKNAMIYSTRGRTPILVAQINKNFDIPYKVIGFLTTNKSKNGIILSGERVNYFDGSEKDFNKILRESDVEYVIFPNSEEFRKEKERLVEYCVVNHIKMMIVDRLRELDGKNDQLVIKPIEIEKLLERDVIKTDIDKISEYMRGKTVLVTGAAGSIGREITLQLAQFDVELVLLDNSETPLHNLQLEMNEIYPKVKAHFRLGDVRSKDRVKRIFEDYKPSVVFHAAAYKHVPMIENNPCEAVLSNVWGTINTAHQAIKFGVDKFIMISTDKAVNPTNVMGASKRIAELYVQSLNCGEENKTKFITTRFGNVLGSNGSVIPHFKKQIMSGGPVTVTHPDIIRYFMTIPEACCLVLQAAMMGVGGEIFVFDMGKQVKIADLARRMILLSGLVPDVDIKIVYTGLRPGEKLYEELLSDEETTNETMHNKIRISTTVATNNGVLNENLRSLVRYAESVNIDETIKIMKLIVPEFVSENSQFEKFDKSM